jgi:HTH-type transcriptional regulator/antitoxin HigA
MEIRTMTRRPAEVFPPGEFLKEELEERGWTQTDLAEILGRTVTLVNEIISGKRGISPETAKGLAAALGTSPELWMNLDASYQLSKVGRGSEEEVCRRAKIYGKAPVKEMIRRGWIEPSENIEVLESRVLAFFRIQSLEDEPQLPRHAARKSTSYSVELSPLQKAWLFRASQLARAVHVQPFSQVKLEEAVEKLKLLLHAPQEVRHVPRVLSDAGVAFVVVQPLHGTKIDGACFWNEHGPVIALSVRFDRIDNFWFVLMHELGHLLKGEDSFDEDLLHNTSPYEKPASEQEADDFATNQLVPQPRIEGFIARVGPIYSGRRIEAFAHTMGVHPGIVVGQLQYRGATAYSSFRKTLVPIREFITSSALTDGWGSVLPANL